MDSLMDLDVNSIDTMLPHFDWKRLESSIKAGQGQADYMEKIRENILQSLAEYGDDDDDDLFPSRKRNNLQICFIKDDDTDETDSLGGSESSDMQNSASTSTGDEEAGDLRREAALWYRQAARMAVMQAQIEKETKKLSKQELSTRGIADVCEAAGFKDIKFNRHSLHKLPSDRLRSIRSDILRLLDELNEKLMSAVVMKDSLHIQQDSLLVDIEDISKRRQEMAKQ